MEHDILSDVLRGIRLRGAVFYDYRFGDEWAAEAPPACEIAPTLLPGAEHVMEYHVLIRGSGWAAVAGQPAVRLAEGDAVVLPHGDRHVMSSRPGLRPQPFDVAWAYAHRHDPRPVPFDARIDGVLAGDAAGEDAPARLVCGFVCCDLHPFNPLVAQLPPLLHLPAAAGSTWILAILRQALQTGAAREPGHEAMLECISELLFVHAVRHYLGRLDAGAGGWLSALRDRRVGHALALLHARPAHAWTLDELGRRVGLSRSALHAHFVRCVGRPPMQYLTLWRMQLAASLLRGSNASIAAIALEAGYDAEAAFTRAFKRCTGLPPAAWRRRATATLPP